jgi:hypothetical protein
MAGTFLIVSGTDYRTFNPDQERTNTTIWATNVEIDDIPAKNCARIFDMIFGEFLTRINISLSKQRFLKVNCMLRGTIML